MDPHEFPTLMESLSIAHRSRDYRSERHEPLSIAPRRIHTPASRGHGGLVYRRDHRSDSLFQSDILRGTENESEIMSIFHQQEQRGGRDFTYEDSGVDNTGGLIRGVRRGMDAPDYVLNDGSLYLDVKTNEQWGRKGTGHLKQGTLRSYARYGAAILMADRDGFFWFSPELIRTVIPKECVLVKKSPMGGKPAYKYTRQNTASWVTRCLARRVEWDPKSQQSLRKGVKWGRVRVGFSE